MNKPLVNEISAFDVVSFESHTDLFRSRLNCVLRLNFSGMGSLTCWNLT